LLLLPLPVLRERGKNANVKSIELRVKIDPLERLHFVFRAP